MSSRAQGRFHFWGESPGTWMAIGISFASAVFAFLSYNSQQSAEQFSTRPLVSFDTEDYTDQPVVGVQIENSGPGAATIKDITYYVDRHPVGNAPHAAAAGKIPAEHLKYLEYDDGDGLGVGERQWIFYRETRDKKGLDDFVHFIDDHLSVSVTYCSVSGSCWTKCSSSTPGLCTATKRPRTSL